MNAPSQSPLPTVSQAEIESAAGPIAVGNEPDTESPVLRQVEAALRQNNFLGAGTAPDLKQPPTSGGEQGGSSQNPGAGPWEVIAPIAGTVVEIIKMGYSDLAGWIKSWTTATTKYHSASDSVLPVGEGLIFNFHGVDDEGQIYFNNEYVAAKGPSDKGTWHHAQARVRPGKNWVIVRVDNSGAFKWWVWVDVFAGSNRKFIQRIHLQGDDGFYQHEHFVAWKIWGR